jgi:hypothetical protein
MNFEEFLFFAVFAALGLFRVGWLPFSLVLVITAFITFITVHKPSGPWGMMEPKIGSSLMATFLMATIYGLIYCAGLLIARSLKRGR